MEPLPFFARLVLACVAFFRVLFDGAYAARVKTAGEPALPAAPEKPEPASEKLDTGAARRDGALLLLGLLQQKGRLVDFLQQDITTFGDADVGTAARLVHEGCRAALADHVAVEPVRAEEEGGSIEVPRGFDAAAIKLVGEVRGDGPWRGTLVHRGWRAREAKLPEIMAGADVTVLAAAEVEVK